jgi:hypothetical protein
MTSQNAIQVEDPLCEILGNRRVLHFGLFSVLEYLHMHDELSWG